MSDEPYSFPQRRRTLIHIRDILTGAAEPKFEQKVEALFQWGVEHFGEGKTRLIFRKAAAGKRQFRPVLKRGRIPDREPDERLWRAFEEAGGSYAAAARLLADTDEKQEQLEAIEKKLQRHIKATGHKHYPSIAALRGGKPIWVRRMALKERLAMALLSEMREEAGDEKSPK